MIIPHSYTFLAKPDVILIMNSDALTYNDIWLIHCHFDHPAYRYNNVVIVNAHSIARELW